MQLSSDILKGQRRSLIDTVTPCHEALVQDLIDTVSGNVSLDMEPGDEYSPHTLYIADAYMLTKTIVFRISYAEYSEEDNTTDYVLYDDVLSEKQTEQLKQHIENNRFFLHAKWLGKEIKQLSTDIKQILIVEYNYDQTVKVLKTGPKMEVVDIVE